MRRTEAREQLLKAKLKPMSDWTPICRGYGGGGPNRFIEAINTAYDKHYPLVLSPDAVWLVIAQGFALPCQPLNGEKLRNLFVEHEGKIDTDNFLRRNDFIKGSGHFEC